MDRWEYLELYVENWRWMDSRGGAGTIPEARTPVAGRRNLTGLMNALGSEGWELVSGAYPEQPKYTLVFKRAKE